MYRDILLPVDLDHPAAGPCATAVALAKAFGARLHVMAVMPTYDLVMVSQYLPAGHEQRMRDDLLQRLHAFVAAEVPQGLPVQSVVGEGRVYQEVLRVARELSADLIVMGSHRPGLGDFLIGSNARKVVQHATCSVMVVRD